MKVHERRKARLDQLIGSPGKRGRIAAFATANDLDASYLSQILNGHSNFGERSARDMEIDLNLEEGYFDQDPESTVDFRRLRPDQIALLEGYEQSSDDLKEAALRLFGALKKIDKEERR